MELARYAREHGISERTLRRQLTALNGRHGGVLRSYGRPGARVGKWWFHPLALQAARTAEEIEGRIEDHSRRIEDLEEKAAALRESFITVRGMVARVRRAG